MPILKQNHVDWVFTPDVNKTIEVRDEEQFLSSNQLFKTILESIQDGVSVLDRSLQIKYINTSMQYWYTGNESVISKKCYEVYHNRKTPCPACPTLRAIETVSPQMEKVQYSANGKNQGWQQLYAVPVVDAEKKVILVIEYIRDITFQRRVEYNLQELEHRFEAMEKQNEMLMQILAQREQNREELEATITSNVEKFIKPTLNYLKKTVREQDVNMVSGLIDEIVYPITKKRPSAINTLTPRELQVCALIKEGNVSKEIAAKLFITQKTVDYHRINIRKKLGIKPSASLRAYLETHL
jgi:Response regulator containing a CheY-like receiver domain and an HTH DNA-binding domain